MTTDVKLTFDNYAGYFNMTPASSTSSPYVYDVDNFLATGAVQQTNDAFTAGNAPGNAAQYLQETTYYDFSTPSVKALAQQAANAAGQSPTQGALIGALLQATTGAVQYDTTALNTEDISTESASQVIAAGKGVCQHFAAVFVAIARANGLPARMVEGYDIGNDAQSGAPYAGAHAWVEVLLDGNYWLPLEPQTTDLALPDLSYFPVAVDQDYEVPVGQPDNPNASNYFDQVANGLVFRKAR